MSDEQSNIPEATPEDDIVERQERYEQVADNQIDKADVAEDAEDEAAYAHRGTTTVASPTAPSAGYVQAEAASMKTAVDGIRTALIAAGILHA